MTTLPTSPTRASERGWVSLALGAATAAWALRPIWDIDLGWHIAVGRWIAAHGWPTVDILSAARPDAPWTTFQGGYQWLVAAVEGAAGLDAVRLLHAVAVGLGMAGLDRVARRAGLTGWMRVTLVALALVLYEDRIRVRPHVFHFAFLWWCMGDLLAPASWRTASTAALRQLAWASLHAPASLWGVALLGASAVAEPRARYRWTALGAAVAGTAVAPGALVGLVGAFSVHTEANLQATLVPEHWPVWHYVDAGLGPHAWLVLSLVATGVGCLLWELALVVRDRVLPSGPLLIATGMAIFSVIMARFAWYAIVPIMLVLARISNQSRSRHTGASAVLALVAVALFAWDAWRYVVPRFEGAPPWTTTLQPGAFPVGAADFLAGAGIHGRIACDSAWGGYLLYRLHPGSRTLTDGRIAFGPEVAELLTRENASNRGELLEEASRRFDVDLAVRRRGAFARNPPRRWVMVYADAEAEVWARDDETLPERLRRTEAFSRRAFSPHAPGQGPDKTQ